MKDVDGKDYYVGMDVVMGLNNWKVDNVKEEGKMNKLEELFMESLRLVSWDLCVEWVVRGRWFKIRNMVVGRRIYDSVMFDFKLRRDGSIIGFGNFMYGGEYDFDMFKKGVIEECVVSFVSRLFRYYD